MNAYDLVMQAINLLYRMNPADSARAGELLQQAITADDNYAAAYTYAALRQIHHVNQGWATNLEADSLDAARLAATAVDRDPTDGFALAVYAHIKAMLFRDYRGAREMFDRALDAAPGNAMVWTLSSGVYSYVGDGQSAVERAERGLRLSPLDTQTVFYLSFLTLAHYVSGTYDEAVIWGRKGSDLNPRHCANLRWLVASLVGLGRNEEARHFARKLLEASPGFRLSDYARWSPLQSNIRNELLARLRTAGLPE
jgi:tetratricopeptide (TPR) repeat protein